MFLSGCGGGSDFTGEDDTSQDTSGVTAPAAGEDTLEGPTTIEPRSFKVDQEAWHSGFHVTFGDGLFTGEADTFTNEVDYWVEIAVNIENLRDEEWSMYTDQFALVANGNASGARGDSELPTVPSGLASNGTLVFAVDESFDTATSAVVVGTADEARAEIPLGGGEAITLEPSSAALTGALEMELLDLTFSDADLQFDNPGFFSNVEAGNIALTLHFDATSRKSGNWQVFADDFALTLPDGSAITPSGSNLTPLPGSDEGTPTADLSLTFVVPDPAAGAYNLRLTVGDWFVGEDGVDEASYEFTLS
jgi:hypothetical protein